MRIGFGKFFRMDLPFAGFDEQLIFGIVNIIECVPDVGHILDMSNLIPQKC